MAITWTTTNSAGLTNGCKFLVYGDAGTGKTRMIATLPAPIMISAEAGELTLRAHSIPVARVTTLKDLQDVFAWITSAAEAQQFQSVALDSVSEMAEIVLAECKKKVRDPRMAYGQMSDIVTDMIKMFRDLPGKHVYMSSKMTTIASEDGILRSAPMLPGKQLGQGVSYNFDFVFRTVVNPVGDKREYKIQTAGDMGTVAKSRIEGLPVMMEPNLGSIIAVAYGQQ